MEALSQVSYLGVFMANILMFLFGGLWYTVLFGDAWKVEVGMDKTKEKAMKQTNAPAIAMIVSFMTGLIALFVIAYFLHVMDLLTVSKALLFSFTVGLGIVGANMLSDGFYNNHSVKLMAINITHRILGLMLGSVVYVLLSSFGWQG